MGNKGNDFMDTDKMFGVIYGQAVGDALGLGTEFLDKAEIKRFYPDGFHIYDQIIQDGHRSRWKKGDWTDDTDQMLCIAKAIIKDKSINPLSVAKEFYMWLHDSPMGIGANTLQVLTFPGYVDNPEKAAKSVWEKSGKRSAANGALMRTSVLGLFTVRIKQNAENICKLTHYDPRCIGSCVIASELINRLVGKGTMTTGEIIDLADKYDPSIKEYVLLAQDEDISNLDLDEEDSIGYTLKTLGAGLWAYFNAVSFKDGLLRVVNEGGDADTNGAVAGSILGAKFGRSGIPSEFIQGLARGNFLTQIADEIIRLAMMENDNAK